jgi:DNA repair exonuclease SbcCD ATPase subunit
VSDRGESEARPRRRVRSVPRWVALVLLTASGMAACATAGATWGTTAGHEATVSGDDLFAAGRHAEAISAYGAELQSVRDADEEARLRLFRALAYLSDEEARGDAQAMEDLRAVERRHGGEPWGHVARILVLELTRRDALREALMRAGADARQTEQRLQRERSRLLTAQALVEAQAKALSSVEDERKALRRQLDAVTEQTQSQQERIIELQRELEALKQIDLGRDP